MEGFSNAVSHSGNGNLTAEIIHMQVQEVKQLHSSIEANRSDYDKVSDADMQKVKKVPRAAIVKPEISAKKHIN